MGCVGSRAGGEWSQEEYYMWPCGHGSFCLECSTAMEAERVGSVFVDCFTGAHLYVRRKQILLSCPVCRTDGFLHRVFLV